MRATIAVAFLALVLVVPNDGALGPSRSAPPIVALGPGPAEAAGPVAAQAPRIAQAKAAEGELVLRLGYVTGNKGMPGVQALAFKEEIERTSKGRVKVEVYCCGQLGGELEQIAAVKAGRLDVFSGAATTVGSLSPTVYVALLPFFYPDRATAWKVLDGEPGQMGLKALEQQGVKGLAWGEAGLHGLLNNRRPVNAVGDLKGLKVRVVETPIFVSTWRALGVTPVPMAYPEVYTGLQQKTVDGVDTVINLMVEAKFFEVTNHLTLTHHAYAGILTIMNLAKFNALPADLQGAVQAAAKAGALLSRKTAQEADEAAIETMKKRGLTITSLPRADLEAATRRVYDEFVPRIGLDIVTKARAIMRTP